MTSSELAQKAIKAKEHAYAPYSKFPVGAALLTKSGMLFTGSNVENSSYGLTICAEQSAISAAVSQGERDFAAIAIACNSDQYCSPCGACRQIIAEFGLDIKVIMVNKKSDFQELTISELLPGAFAFNVNAPK